MWCRLWKDPGGRASGIRWMPWCEQTEPAGEAAWLVLLMHIRILFNGYPPSVCRNLLRKKIVSYDDEPAAVEVIHVRLPRRSGRPWQGIR